jgi:hypothetical protein
MAPSNSANTNWPTWLIFVSLLLNFASALLVAALANGWHPWDDPDTPPQPRTPNIIRVHTEFADYSFQSAKERENCDYRLRRIIQSKGPDWVSSGSSGDATPGISETNAFYNDKIGVALFGDCLVRGAVFGYAAIDDATGKKELAYLQEQVFEPPFHNNKR